MNIRYPIYEGVYRILTVRTTCNISSRNSLPSTITYNSFKLAGREDSVFSRISQMFN